jgi:hypothetical protein
MPREIARGHIEGGMASGNTPRPPGEMLGEAERRRFADLMAAVAARQDRAAYSELFAYYAPRVKSYLMRLGADGALAEEIAQDVMVTVWRKAALFDRTQAQCPRGYSASRAIAGSMCSAAPNGPTSIPRKP